ncbi:hypothetical protein LVJ94_51885 [Pendulispora rubella]|uniref:Uncharacterized protein n=1 Tax=Pendulispora rubella TaxID=2741070 RepID=A0ABZ2L6H7_9BACT
MAYAVAFVVGLPASKAEAHDGQADDPVRVVVFGRPNASFLARMRAELESLGWQVFSPRPRADHAGMAPSRAELEATAREFRAIALVEIDDESALHVWVIDAAGHARPVEVLQTPAEDITALRSAEVVRAAVEYRPTTRATEPSARPSTPRKFALGVGASMLAMPYGGMSLGWNLRFEARYEFKPTLGIAAFFGMPLAPSRWYASDKSTDIRAWLGGAGPVLMWHSKEELWAVRAGFGLAVAGLQFRGAVHEGGHEVSPRGPVIMPFVQLEAGLRLVANIHWNAGILVGQGLPRTILKAEGDKAAWGQPLTMVSTTLDVTF